MTADPGRLALNEEWEGEVADTVEPRPIIESVSRFEGRIWSIRSDTVDFAGHQAVRDVQLHLGAVAVIAIDDEERVLLIRQYRHPVAMALFEPPAGLLDVAGEEPHLTAARELAEESGYEASSWHVLVDFLNSPGGSSEAIRVYLATNLQPIPGGRPHTGEAEEAHLPRAWVDLDEAKDLVLSGRIGSPTAVCGILAAWASRAGGWASLRPVDEPWSARDTVIEHERVNVAPNH
jgi:8-oxo-dGTP pyrophosphatase MutT (NUDIX family)